MLSSSVPTASVSVSLEVAVSHAECAYQLRSQRAAPVSIPSAAVKYKLRPEQSWTGSTKNSVIQAQLSTSYSDVTSTSQIHPPGSVYVSMERKKAHAADVQNSDNNKTGH